MAVDDPTTLKICSFCRISKPISSFHISRKEKSGRVSRCKACCSEQQKKRRTENPERIREIERASHDRPEAREKKRLYRERTRQERLAKKRAYYRENRERILEQQAEYCAINLEKRRAASQVLYQRKRQVYIDKARAWKKAHPERLRELRRLRAMARRP